MKRKGVLIGVAVLLILAIALGIYWQFGNRSGALQLHGIVEIQEVRLGSKVGGRVDQVLVKEGQTIEAGDVLIVFQDPELQAQRKELLAELGKAEADLDKVDKGLPRDIEAAKAGAAAARGKWEKIKEGWRPEEVQMAKDDYDVAVADKKFADLEFDRINKLFEKSSAAKGELDLADANIKRTKAKLGAAKTKLKMYQDGGWEKERDIAKKEMDQADANYKKLIDTEYSTRMQAEQSVNSLRAKLERNDVDLKETKVRALEKCIVETISVRAGDVVAPNQPVVRVLRAADMWVKVFVPETDIGKVQLNQQVQVTVDAYPGKDFTGKVIQVATISEFTPRNVQSKEERRYQVFPVKIRVDNPQGVFKAGMAADVIVPANPIP